ncbi:MAG: hypothetical protein Fur0020_07450 [Thermodesulfovibrionia bacterium]
MCSECITDEPHFEYARSYGIYEGAIEEAIKLLKYHGVKRLSRPLSDLLFSLPLPPVDVIIPVPLHGKRLKERGFNQSAIIGRHISRGIGMPLLINSLIRTRDTLPQVGLNAKDRKRNIKGAFSVQDKKGIYKKRVLLIDDVLTTGSTARECSKVLKMAGAKSVYVMTIAYSRK